MSKNFAKYIKADNLFKAIPETDIATVLDPGVYNLKQTPQGEIVFERINTNHDKLIDLPSPEYDYVVSEIEFFMRSETKESFREFGYLYKRSSLLFGPPGTGKTCIVNRIANKVTAEGGIVIFSPNPRLLIEAFKIFDSIQPQTRVMVILEELDELLKHYESELLNVLDGEIQKDNVIFMATTNHIDKIPARIRRPGRFSSTIEVKYPTPATREFYLKLKMPHILPEHLSLWVAQTENFSIDELKETVLAVKCLNQPLGNVVERIKQAKGINTPKSEEDEDDWIDESDDEVKAELPSYKIEVKGKR